MATKDERRADPIRQGVGIRLKAAREGKGLGQQEVADRFGICKGTVSAWETVIGDDSQGSYVLGRCISNPYSAAVNGQCQALKHTGNYINAGGVLTLAGPSASTTYRRPTPTPNGPPSAGFFSSVRYRSSGVSNFVSIYRIIWLDSLPCRKQAATHKHQRTDVEAGAKARQCRLGQVQSTEPDQHQKQPRKGGRLV